MKLLHAYTFSLLVVTGLSACQFAQGEAQSNSAELTEAASISGDPAKYELQGDNVWDVLKTESDLKFSGKYRGNPFTGEFKQFDAAVDMDLDNPDSGRIKVRINMASVDVRDPDGNGFIKSDAWLDVETFPFAEFQSTKITGSFKDGYVATGPLTLLDVTQDVTLSFDVDVDGEIATANGSLQIDRSEFGVGKGAYKTDKEIPFAVDVKFTLTAKRNGL